ncbi:centrosomal protein of 135 kDa-like [Ornithodoros turicata]|uniref:centrosomal protein of 135 kDa-like n=1 Tax=Ornithodoros turicata TaxID=34597 RepID=UPI003139282D
MSNAPACQTEASLSPPQKLCSADEVVREPNEGDSYPDDPAEPSEEVVAKDGTTVNDAREMLNERRLPENNDEVDRKDSEIQKLRNEVAVLTEQLERMKRHYAEPLHQKTLELAALRREQGTQSEEVYRLTQTVFIKHETIENLRKELHQAHEQHSAAERSLKASYDDLSDEYNKMSILLADYEARELELHGRLEYEMTLRISAEENFERLRAGTRKEVRPKESGTELQVRRLDDAIGDVDSDVPKMCENNATAKKCSAGHDVVQRRRDSEETLQRARCLSPENPLLQDDKARATVSMEDYFPLTIQDTANRTETSADSNKEVSDEYNELNNSMLSSGRRYDEKGLPFTAFTPACSSGHDPTEEAGAPEVQEGNEDMQDMLSKSSEESVFAVAPVEANNVFLSSAVEDLNYRCAAAEQKLQDFKLYHMQVVGNLLEEKYTIEKSHNQALAETVDLQLTLESANAQHAVDLAEKQANVQYVAEELAEARDELRNLSKNALRLNRELTAKQAELEEARKDLAAWNESSPVILLHYYLIKSKLESLCAQLKVWKASAASQLEEEVAQTKAVTTKLEAAQEEIDRMTKERGDVSAKIQALQMQVAELTGRLAAAEEQKEYLEHEVNRAIRSNQSNEQERVLLESELSILRKRLREQERNSANELHTDVRELEAQVASLKLDLEQSQAEATEAWTHLEDSYEQLRQSRAFIAWLHARMRRYKNRLAEPEQRMCDDDIVGEQPTTSETGDSTLDAFRGTSVVTCAKLQCRPPPERRYTITASAAHSVGTSTSVENTPTTLTKLLTSPERTRSAFNVAPIPKSLQPQRVARLPVTSKVEARSSSLLARRRLQARAVQTASSPMMSPYGTPERTRSHGRTPSGTREETCVRQVPSTHPKNQDDRDV